MARDPLESLLGELLSAHDRLRAGEQPVADRSAGRVRSALRGVWLGRRRRTVAALAAGALAVTATATAAVVIAVSSQPLTGRLPSELLGTRYALWVAPDLQAGHAGWCVSLLDIDANDAVLPAPDACVSGRGPLIARGGIAVLSTKTGRETARLLYAIVDRRVAALRAPDGTTIRPVASRALPRDWRAAVIVQAHPASSGGHSAATAITLTPLGADGRPLSTVTGEPETLPTQNVSAGRSGRPGCSLRVSAAPGLQLGDARRLAAPLPRGLPGATGFLACYSLNIDAGGGVSVAALLVDAAHPGAAAPSLPGFRPLRAQSGIWIGPATTAGGADTGMLQRLFARRAGHAWLVLETPASQAMALAMLDRITASG